MKKNILLIVICFSVYALSAKYDGKGKVKSSSVKQVNSAFDKLVDENFTYQIVKKMDAFVINNNGKDTQLIGKSEILIDSTNVASTTINKTDSVFLRLKGVNVFPNVEVGESSIIYVVIKDKYIDVRELLITHFYPSIFKKDLKVTDKYLSIRVEKDYFGHLPDWKEAYQRNSLFVSINYLYGYSYRNLQVNSSDAGLSISERYKVEESLPQGNAVFKAGYVIQCNHYLFANFSIQQFGFSLSEPKGYDWKAGTFNQENPTIYQLYFRTKGLGVGYRYALFRSFRHVIPFIEGSLNYNWIGAKAMDSNVMRKVSMDIIRQQSFPVRSISATIQGGISIAIHHGTALSIAPYYTSNLHGFKGSQLTTRFHNYGLNIGFDVRSGTFQNRKKLRNNMRE